MWWWVAARGNGERSSCEKVLCDAASASVAVVCGGALAFCPWVNARVRVPAEAMATAGSRGGSRQVPDFRGAGGASVVSADRSTTSSRSVAHGVRRLDWSGCMNGPVHPEQFIALSHSDIDIEY